MATFIFVHGIGRRANDVADRLKASLDAGITRISTPEIAHKLGFCYWGGEYGTPAVERFESIPDFEERGGRSAQEREQEQLNAEDVALWDLLYRDPEFDLRVLATKGDGKAVDGAIVRKRKKEVANINMSGKLTALLNEAGLHEGFDGAKQKVLNSDAFKPAVAEPSATRFREATARAILAHAVLTRLERLEYPPFLAKKDVRNRLFAGVVGDMGGFEAGVPMWLARKFLRKGVNYLTRHFAWAAMEFYRTLGDIFHYQGEGGNYIRELIRGEVIGATPPVILLGHSLGGIACVEMLIEEAKRKGEGQDSPVLRQLQLLVTVGSQAPFLYEINALQSFPWDRAAGRPRPADLPNAFPRWLNIYDPEDILSFMAAPIFQHNGKLADEKVESGQPFPQSHSAYWDNPVTWGTIAHYLT